MNLCMRVCLIPHCFTIATEQDKQYNDTNNMWGEREGEAKLMDERVESRLIEYESYKEPM